MSLYRPLLAGEAVCRLEQPGPQQNPRGAQRLRGGWARPLPPARRRPRPRAACSPAEAPPPRRHNVPAGARACPLIPRLPAPAATIAACRRRRRRRRRCQPPSGDSICSQVGLAAAKAGGERCPRAADRRPLGQAPARSLAGCGGDILVAGVHGGIRAPREQRRPAFRSSPCGERPSLTRLLSDLLISGGRQFRSRSLTL